MVSLFEEARQKILLIIARKGEETFKVKIFVRPDFGLDFELARRNIHAGKICFGACESSPGSAKVTTFSLGGGSTLGDLGQGCVHHIAH